MLGIGIDIVAVPRMRETLARSGSTFINKVYTENEREDSLAHLDAAVYFAKVFAAKEAVFKTFASGWGAGMSFLDIEIRNGTFGEPEVFLHGRFQELLVQKNGSRILISLTWEQEIAAAVAVMV